MSDEWIWNTPHFTFSPWADQIERVAQHGLTTAEVRAYYQDVWDSNASVTLWLLEGNPDTIAAVIRHGADPALAAEGLDTADPLLASTLRLEPVLAGKAACGRCMHDSADWDALLLDLRAAVAARLHLG